jgi:hypothetical protein
LSEVLLADLSQLGPSELVKCFGISWGYRKVFTSNEPISECLYLDFVTLFLRSEAWCRLARQFQSQLLNEQLGV